MSSNLRLSPSGPQVGPVSLMPLRVVEDEVTLAEPLTLTGVAQDVSASLRCTLTAPFDPTHYFSAECDFDVINESEDESAHVSIAILVSIDGGPTQTVHSQIHRIGANDGAASDDRAQIQPMACRAIPSGILNWGNPPADAQEMTISVVALMVSGADGEVSIKASPCWLALREHTAPASGGLRLPPSGPPMGGMSLAPVRDAEDTATLEASLVLTGVAQDVSSGLRATLAGPFDPTHYFSAECELDISNGSSNQLAAVGMAIEVSWDGGSTWAGEHSVTHLIGANEADELRSIRPASVHVIPIVFGDWTPPDGAESMTVRVTATMSSGQAGVVLVEGTEMWLRLTEHSPEPAINMRLSPSGPVIGPASLMPMRINEEDRVRETPLVLTDTAQDVSASLWCELEGPFDASHRWSAECDLDVSNGSTNVLAEVTVAIQVSVDDGSTWNDVHTETHDVGPNAADQLRQIRPIRVHCPPLPIGGWQPLAAGTETMTVRVTATADEGETGLVQVEVAEMWLRLTEHSAT